MLMTNVQLADRIHELRPKFDRTTIGKAVVKMRKLAKTLRNRESAGELYLGDETEWRSNTQKFFKKATALAREIDCLFEGHKNIGETEWIYYVRIGDVIERLV